MFTHQWFGGPLAGGWYMGRLWGLVGWIVGFGWVDCVVVLGGLWGLVDCEVGFDCVVGLGGLRGCVGWIVGFGGL